MWSYRIVLLVCANLFCVTRSLSGDTTQDFFQNQSWSGSSPLHANLFRLLKNDGPLDIDLLAGLADSTYVDDSLSAEQNRSGEIEEEDYKTPTWPKSKDEVCYSNVPPTLLVADKGGQNWITIKRIKFVFPRDMLPMTPCLFWNLVAREGCTSIWQKTTNDSAYFGPSSSKLPPLDDKDPNWVRFSSALMSQNEEVPSVVLMAAFNTLPVILDWKWTGVAHDWCKAFDTYPHLYDILHSLTSPYGAALWTFIWGEARSTLDQEQDNQFSMHSIKHAAKNDGPSNQQNFLLLLVTFGLMVIFMWEMFGPLVFICIIILGALWYLFMTST